jgi:NB-ARC domain
MTDSPKLQLKTFISQQDYDARASVRLLLQANPNNNFLIQLSSRIYSNWSEYHSGLKEQETYQRAKANTVVDLLDFLDMDENEINIPKIPPSSLSTFPEAKSTTFLTNTPAKPNIIGRKADLEKLSQLVWASQDFILVHGLAGIGKTIITEALLHHIKNRFDYIVWVEVNQQDFKTAFVNNTVLMNHLHLNPQLGREADTYELIKNKLSNLKGKKLLIIDNLDFQGLDRKAIAIEGWTVIVTSRSVLKDFTPYRLEALDETSLIALFKRYYTIEDHPERLQKIVRLAHCHTFLLEIIAKIANYNKYDLNEIYKLLVVNALDIESDTEKTILKRLWEFFEKVPLDETERMLLMELSLFPTPTLSLKEIKAFLDIKGGIFDKLCVRGWIEERPNQEYYIHPLIQQIVRQKMLPTIKDLPILSTVRDRLEKIEPVHEKISAIEVAKTIDAYFKNPNFTLAQLYYHLNDIFVTTENLQEALQYANKGIAVLSQLEPNPEIQLLNGCLERNLGTTYVHLATFAPENEVKTYFDKGGIFIENSFNAIDKLVAKDDLELIKARLDWSHYLIELCNHNESIRQDHLAQAQELLGYAHARLQTCSDANTLRITKYFIIYHELCFVSHFFKDDLERAEHSLQASEQLKTTLYTKDSLEWATLCCNKGILLVQKKQFKDAEKFLKQSVAIYDKSFGEILTLKKIKILYCLRDLYVQGGNNIKFNKLTKELKRIGRDETTSLDIKNWLRTFIL